MRDLAFDKDRTFLLACLLACFDTSESESSKVCEKVHRQSDRLSFGTNLGRKRRPGVHAGDDRRGRQVHARPRPRGLRSRPRGVPCGLALDFGIWTGDSERAEISKFPTARRNHLQTLRILFLVVLTPDSFET